MQLETRLAQAGNRQDLVTGSVSLPIYQSATFSHPELGKSTGFDYARTSNPTRKALEETIANLENGVQGFAFSSGMAAIHAILGLFQPGDHLLASRDIYGGTYRILEQILTRYGIKTTFVDTSNLQAIKTAFQANTKALFIETPTNPTMQITDLSACATLARQNECLLIVDNTFMTPYLQRPIDLGADIVIHSATKYLGGHNDVLAGLVVVKNQTLAEQIQFLQNSIGAVLGPQDSWLIMRGMKTLALRVERQQENAQIIADWLSRQPYIDQVFYPGLAAHPNKQVHEQQATGHGGILSFEVTSPQMVAPILANLKLITFAESLGGVESLITFPARQTHAEIPEEIRNASGVSAKLLRLSLGIEHYQDLLNDLSGAISSAVKEVTIK